MVHIFKTLLICWVCVFAESLWGGQEKTEPPNTAKEYDLRPYFDWTNDLVRLNFAGDGRSICAWWKPYRRPGNPEKAVVEFVIVDLQTDRLRTSRETNHSEVFHDFPMVAWREMWKDFVKDAIGWAFTQDFFKGLRILPSTGYGQFVAEMWDLPQKKKPLWRTELPSPAYRPHPIELFQEFSSEAIPIATTPVGGVFLSGTTGAIKGSFTFGPIESDEEASMRKKRFHLKYSDGDPALTFSTFTFSYDPKRNLLACGTFDDRRVRTILVTEPDRIVFEAHSNENPARPRGGKWSVQRVEFLSNGKYLLASASFGGRLTIISLEPTEIFETSTWKLVWQENDTKVRAVTLSPDGTKIAYLRENTLEVSPFKPNLKGSVR